MPHLLVTHSQFRFRGPLRVFLALVFSSPSPGTARVPGVSDWRGIHSLRGGLRLWLRPQAGWVALSFSFTASHPPFRLLETPGNGLEELPCPRALELRDFQAGQLCRWRGRAGGRGRGSRSRGATGWRGGSRADPGPLLTGLLKAPGASVPSSWGGAQGQGVGVPGHRSYSGTHRAAGLTSGRWSHRKGVLLPGGVEARQGCDS